MNPKQNISQSEGVCNCRKCKSALPPGAKFCPMCAAPVEILKAPKGRANGTGSVFRRGRSWTAIVTVSYYIDAEGKHCRKTRSKGGFKTKRDAINYLPILRSAPMEQIRLTTFRKVYELWLPTHDACKSTLNCYKAAFKYFAPIEFMHISDLTIDDLQDCVDDCDKGRRTKENMKALAGLLYKYALPRKMLYDNLNIATFLKVSGESGSKDGLPLEAVEKIRKAAETGNVPGADYVLCQCYLGFRPGELIALDASKYDRTGRAFIGGSKTDAGRDRTVTVSPKIQPYIDALIKDKIGGAVFASRSGGAMSIKEYRQLFYNVLKACGIDNPVTVVDNVEYHKYTPHSCRHTFATLMKRVDGADKDKLELIGHTSTEMLRHYQDVDLEDLRRITDAL